VTTDVFSIEVDQTQRIIRVTVTGHFNDAVYSEFRRALRALPEFNERYGVLLDLRRITALEISSDAVVIFGHAAKNDLNRMAILTNNINADAWARIYQMIANSEANRVYVCNDLESATEWIGG
jgi:SpoIIAA-like